MQKPRAWGLSVAQRSLLSMLVSPMPLEIVLAREASEVGTVRMFTVKGSHGRRWVTVATLVSAKVFRVQKALVAGRTYVRPLTLVIRPLMAAGNGQLRGLRTRASRLT